MFQISVQEKDFDVAQLYQQLTSENTQDGAVVTFVGRVRDFNQGHEVNGLALEHYPGMTEKVLRELASMTADKFAVNRIAITHRIGELFLGDQIVFVGVTSPHRSEAFTACQWIMDTLKSSAPFWKKELTPQGVHWVTPN